MKNSILRSFGKTTVPWNLVFFYTDVIVLNSGQLIAYTYIHTITNVVESKYEALFTTSIFGSYTKIHDENCILPLSWSIKAHV